MSEPRRIAILTGGGDVPGLNAVIKSVVYRATEAGYTTLGILKLITFGGCGIWYIVDLILIAMGNLDDSQGRPLRRT